METSAHDLESMLAAEESARIAEAEAGARYRADAGCRPWSGTREERTANQPTSGCSSQVGA